MRIFELYAPFARLIQEQLPSWFIDLLPDAGLRQDYNRLINSQLSNKEDKNSPAMKEAMLVRIDTLKQSPAAKTFLGFAWLIFIWSLVPLQFGKESLVPMPVGISTAFCEVVQSY